MFQEKGGGGGGGRGFASIEYRVDRSIQFIDNIKKNKEGLITLTVQTKQGLTEQQ